MRFEEMKVAELKQESRNRGLTLESKGHKFTKQELIDRLNAYENETDEAWVETKGFETETLETEERKFATLEEIEMAQEKNSVFMIMYYR